MSLQIIQHDEIAETFDARVVLVDIGEPGLFGVRQDTAFLINRVEHEYVKFDTRCGEIIRLNDDALEALKAIA